MRARFVLLTVASLVATAVASGTPATATVPGNPSAVAARSALSAKSTVQTRKRMARSAIRAKVNANYVGPGDEISDVSCSTVTPRQFDCTYAVANYTRGPQFCDGDGTVTFYKSGGKRVRITRPTRRWSGGEPCD